MLSTLLKLGEQLSENRGEWEDIIDIPNTEKEKQKGYNLYVAELVFDLDQQQIYVSPNLREYDNESPLKFCHIKTKNPGDKAINLCVENKKLEKIAKALFGKIDSGKREKEPTQGEIIEAINKDMPILKNSKLYSIIEKLFPFRSKFLSFFNQQDENDELKPVEKVLSESLNLGAKDRIILWASSVIDSESEILKLTPLASFDGYTDLIKSRFVRKSNQNVGISYASGKLKDEVKEAKFAERYGINKMFVTTTKNYLSQFEDKNIKKNYQLDVQEQNFLDIGSEYLLENQTAKIAEISHCIIPQFLNHSEVNIKDVLYKGFRKSELLFQTQVFGILQTEIEDSIDNKEPYWINFLAFDTEGGQTFKTLNLIKDVSSLHLIKVIHSFINISSLMKKLKGIVDWESVMTYFSKNDKKLIWRDFNLNTIFYIIPQRRAKKNEALELFKTILEQRKINPAQIFHYFCNLILCHYYKRYDGFENINKPQEDIFDYLVRDAVFKYLAFIQVLKQLNLLENMETNEENVLELIPLEETAPADFGQQIEHFFALMNYNDAQKSMFYLGRMLSSVAYIQKDKKKTVLEKVNFNGMDRKEIQRLRIALMEKAEQYKEIGKIIFNDSQFTKHFDFNNWNMSEQEAVFFLLSGYSFGIKAKEKII